MKVSFSAGCCGWRWTGSVFGEIYKTYRRSSSCGAAAIVLRARWGRIDITDITHICAALIPLGSNSAPRPARPHRSPIGSPCTSTPCGISSGCVVSRTASSDSGASYTSSSDRSPQLPSHCRLQHPPSSSPANPRHLISIFGWGRILQRLWDCRRPQGDAAKLERTGGHVYTLWDILISATTIRPLLEMSPPLSANVFPEPNRTGSPEDMA